MTLPEWHEEPIAKSHDRKSFDCGDASLNTFLARHARQNHETGGAKTFCAIDNLHPNRLLGFYSLAPASIGYGRLPAVVSRALPRHDISGFLLARLATYKDLHGQGLGGQLLLAAGRRCLRVAAEAGGVALIIDAENDQAANWYESYGAMRLEESTLTLVLPLETVRAALEKVSKL